MKLSNSACNEQKLLLVSSYPPHSNSSQWARVYSTTVSCSKWHVWGPGRQLLAARVPWTAIVRTGHAWWLFKDYNCSQKCFPFGMEEGFHVGSQNASGPSSGSWVSWCMYICSVIQQLLLFPKWSQVTFSITEVGLLWLFKHSVPLTPATFHSIPEE